MVEEPIEVVEAPIEVVEDPVNDVIEHVKVESDDEKIKIISKRKIVNNTCSRNGFKRISWKQERFVYFSSR